MTVGYLKDVQHLREMFVRKELNPQYETYDVQHYDVLKSFDPSL